MTQIAICLAKFGDPIATRAAIRQLQHSGVLADQMEVMTCQPIHGEPFLPQPEKTALRTWALAGAAAGAVGGFLLAAITAMNYPLVKGGMPIVAPWTVGIITYETMMLGAILATLLGFLTEVRLPNLKKLPYDESIADGGVLLAVQCPNQDRTAIQHTVETAGAIKIDWA